MNNSELDRAVAQLKERGFALHGSEPSPTGTVKYALLDYRTREPRVGLRDGAAGLTWEQVERVIENPAGADWADTVMYAEHLTWWRSLSDEQRATLLALPDRQPITGQPISYVTGGEFLFSSFAEDHRTLDWKINMGEGFWLFLDERRAEA